MAPEPFSTEVEIRAMGTFKKCSLNKFITEDSRGSTVLQVQLPFKLLTRLIS